MTLAWEIDAQTERLLFHFDVKDHHLNLDTFMRTADSARKVVEALDRTLFKGDFGFEIIVMPPTGGTFKEWLGIHPKSKLTFAAIAMFMCTPQGEAFTKGLTGQTTSEWFEDAGILLRQGIEFSTDLMIAVIGTGEGVGDEVGITEGEAEIACKTATRIVTSMTRNIFELSTEALNKIGMEVGDLPDAFDARAEFYEACLNDAEVRRVGFTPEDDFPIPRNSFAERAQRSARKDKEKDEPEWTVVVDQIRVDSPTWDKEKQKTRQWLGVNSNKRDCYFVIEDAEFWERLRKKELQFGGSDTLTVQWAFQSIDGKIKNRRVLRVLEFNGQKLADQLPTDAINAILGSYMTGVSTNGTPTLFD
jgi:hypothetical protein